MDNIIDKNSHYFILMHPSHLNKNKEDNREKWVECIVVEDNYKLKDNYKVQFKSIEKGYGTRIFYASDIKDYIDKRYIVKKQSSNMKCIEEIWPEPIYNNINLIHKAYTLKEENNSKSLDKDTSNKKSFTIDNNDIIYKRMEKEIEIKTKPFLGQWVMYGMSNICLEEKEENNKIVYKFYIVDGDKKLDCINFDNIKDAIDYLVFFYEKTKLTNDAMHMKNIFYETLGIEKDKRKIKRK